MLKGIFNCLCVFNIYNLICEGQQPSVFCLESYEFLVSERRLKINKYNIIINNIT